MRRHRQLELCPYSCPINRFGRCPRGRHPMRRYRPRLLSRQVPSPPTLTEASELPDTASRFFIAYISTITHVAGIVGTPTIILFSPDCEFIFSAKKTSSTLLLFVFSWAIKAFRNGPHRRGRDTLDHRHYESKRRRRQDHDLDQCRRGHRLDGKESPAHRHGPSGPQHDLDRLES